MEKPKTEFGAESTGDLQARQESKVPSSDENVKPIKSYKIIYESVIKIMKTTLVMRSVGKHAKQIKQL